jgi:hypothetical protein
MIFGVLWTAGGMPEAIRNGGNGMLDPSDPRAMRSTNGNRAPLLYDTFSQMQTKAEDR